MDAIKCEAFLITAETGSITAAAAQMGYTQSGITRMIAGLEEEMGFRLFSRSKRGVELTDNGREMLPFFREIVHSFKSAEQYCADIRGSIQGSISVGSYYSISANIMPGILKKFREEYPGVSVKIQEGSNLEMARWLREKSVDCCFCAKPEIPEIQWLPLIRDEIVMWLPPDHPLCFSSSYPVKQLEEETQFIHTAPGRDTELDRLIALNDLDIHAFFTTKDGYTTYSMVEAGLGVSFNQKLISKRWSGKVNELSFDPPQFIDLGIALPPGTDASPAVRRFIKCVKESMPADDYDRSSR